VAGHEKAPGGGEELSGGDALLVNEFDKVRADRWPPGFVCCSLSRRAFAPLTWLTGLTGAPAQSRRSAAASLSPPNDAIGV